MYMTQHVTLGKRHTVGSVFVLLNIMYPIICVTVMYVLLCMIYQTYYLCDPGSYFASQPGGKGAFCPQADISSYQINCFFIIKFQKL